MSRRSCTVYWYRMEGFRSEQAVVWDCLNASATQRQTPQGEWLTMRPLRPVNIKHHIDGLFDLKDALRSIRRAHWSYVHSHSLPGCIKELVPVQQARYASLTLARKQLQEWREILCAYHFMWQSTVQ